MRASVWWQALCARIHAPENGHLIGTFVMMTADCARSYLLLECSEAWL